MIINNHNSMSVGVGNEFETMDIAPFSAPPELPEVMKIPEPEVSSSEVAKSESRAWNRNSLCCRIFTSLTIVST